MSRENPMDRLEGKIALVTGGTSGIGLATAKRFVGEGAYVFITGRRDRELAAAVKEIGRNVTGVQGDMSSLGDLDRLFAQIKREKGKLDVVFANAGVAKYAPFGTITEDDYDSIFDVNVKGVLFTVWFSGKNGVKGAMSHAIAVAEVLARASVTDFLGVHGPNGGLYSAGDIAINAGVALIPVAGFALIRPEHGTVTGLLAGGALSAAAILLAVVLPNRLGLAFLVTIVAMAAATSNETTTDQREPPALGPTMRPPR